METNTALTQTSRPIAAYALPFCLAAMDGCAVYLAAWLLGAATLPAGAGLAVPPYVLAALELAAWWLGSTLLDRTALSTTTAQALTGGVGLLASLGVAAAVTPQPP